MDKNITRKLRVIGKPADIIVFEKYAEPYNNFEGMQEAQARNIIQELLDTKLPSSLVVLYDGNTVWGKEKVMRQFKKLLKNYSFENFPDHLYKFFSLCCGSIAHYNRMGWFDVYPTKNHLASFFSRNEYGNSVLGHQPHWAVDRIHIAREMSKLLGVR